MLAFAVTFKSCEKVAGTQIVTHLPYFYSGIVSGNGLEKKGDSEHLRINRFISFNRHLNFILVRCFIIDLF